MKSVFGSLSKSQQTNLLLGVGGIVVLGLVYYVIFEKDKKPEKVEQQSLSSASFISGPDQKPVEEDKMALYKQEEKDKEQAERLSSENVAQKAFFGGGPKTEENDEELTAQEKYDKMNAALEKGQSASPVTVAEPSEEKKSVQVVDKKPSTTAAPRKTVAKKEPEIVEPEPAPSKTSFYTVKKEASPTEETDADLGYVQGIRAIVHNEQTVHQGDNLRVRILDPITANGIELKENTILYGSVSFSKNRVMVKFVNAQLAGKLIPLNKSAYGTDGLQGLLVGDLGATSDIGNSAINDGIATATRSLTGSRALGNASRGVVKERKDEKVTLPNEYAFIIK